jgi:flagellin
MRINTNIMALNAHRQLMANQTSSARSMEKLSSGLRINRAGDDAAGLAISEKMRGQIRGLQQAERNAQDGISLIQTAEGALNETHSILQRMRELAVQSASDTNTDVDRTEIQKEVDQLSAELTRIADTTEFNTQNLLVGDLDVVFHIGANEGQNIGLKIDAMDAVTLGVAVDSSVGVAATGTLEGVDFAAKTAGVAGNSIQIEFVDPSGNDAELSVSVSGNTITVNLATDGSGDITSTVEEIVAAINTDTDASALVTASGAGTDPVTAGTTNLAGGADGGVGGIGGIDVSTQLAADTAITTIDSAIQTVSAERSKLGALQNRLEHTIANLGTSAENLQAAESRIRDVDMAAEMMAFTKFQILQQASTAMLAQANMAPQSVLQLLG